MRLLLVFLFAASTAAAQNLAVPRAAMFRPAGFPTVDASEIPAATLDRAVANLPVDAVDSVDSLRVRLASGRYEVLILPHGSAFPIEAWPEIRTFLKSGGGLVSIGGAPLHQPVRKTPNGWELGVRQPTFAHEFLIGPAEHIEVNRQWKVNLPEKSWEHPVDGAKSVWALTTRLATRADSPGEHGSEGYRDSILRPLVHLSDNNGIPRACPLLEIDHLRNDAAGTRWVLAPTDAPLSAEVLRAMILRAFQGAVELEAAPAYASFEPGEVPRIRVVVSRPGNDATASRAGFVVRTDAGELVHRDSVNLIAGASTAEIRTARPLKPGLYHVEVMIPDVSFGPRSTTTGFWVRDSALLTGGPKVTVARDWLRRDGKVFPVIGTTYMASDVHRKFLFEPDPHVWDRDFQMMARLGINFVRTGIWTGWSHVMVSPGVVDEGFLRALDGYVQTAAKHGIVVNFTFFAFLPPAHGGSNPYLDPRSLDGQRQFLTAVARRFRGVGWIHYDLINEPSYAPPSGLWSNRPIRDEWERRAWREWVQQRHGNDTAKVRDRWHDRGDPFEVPAEHELWYAQIREDRRPRKVRDFVVFSNEVIARWAAQLRSDLRAAGGEVLVTLGQDEGGTWQRPSQQLHAESIDYTAVHPWWQNDDVLATGVFVKVPEKPSLFQETGLMRLEDVDGWPWRSPQHAAALLERKYAYAFAARNAGVIEWAWNINPYMPIDNESVIGFFRPDGTAKPELDIVPEFAGFFREAGTWLDDFEPDPVVVVIPHSRLFMNRPAATDGFRRMIRVLAERLGVVPTAISELRLTAERLRQARLVIIPSAEFLDDAAAETLAAASSTGTKILVLGAVTGNPYGEITPALRELGIADEGQPVRLREWTAWSDAPVTFDRNLQESLLRSTAEPTQAFRRNVWHEPVPLEHAREDEPLVALLAAAMSAAGVETHPAPGGIAARLLVAPRSILAVLVNEGTRDMARRVTVAGRVYDIPVPAERSRLVLFDRKSGRVITQTEGEGLDLALVAASKP